MFCALTMYAVSYASPYKGSAHGGYVAQPVYHSVGSVGIAQQPTATMGSTSAYRGTINSGVMATVKPVRGIYTSASAVRGGVTSGQTYGRMNGPRRARMEETPIHPGDPDDDDDPCPHCHDDIINATGEPGHDNLCDECGHDMYECTCEGEDGYCWCPIGDGWDVWLFMAVLGTGYAFVARRRVKS